MHEILSSLGVPVVMYQYEGAENTYITYQPILKKPSLRSDDTFYRLITLSKVDLFTRQADYENLTNQILELLKVADFYIKEIVEDYEKETDLYHVSFLIEKEM